MKKSSRLNSRRSKKSPYSKKVRCLPIYSMQQALFQRSPTPWMNCRQNRNLCRARCERPRHLQMAASPILPDEILAVSQFVGVRPQVAPGLLLRGAES